MVETNLQITDNRNAPEQPEPGTDQVFPFQFAVQCVATADATQGLDLQRDDQPTRSSRAR